MPRLPDTHQTITIRLVPELVPDSSSCEGCIFDDDRIDCGPVLDILGPSGCQGVILCVEDETGANSLPSNHPLASNGD